MSARADKKLRQLARRHLRGDIELFAAGFANMPLWQRLKFAWAIARGRNPFETLKTDKPKTEDEK